MGRGGFQGVEQARGGASDLVDGSLEGGLVGFRGFVESSDFPDELQGSGAHLFRGDRRVEIEKRLDVAAQFQSSVVSYQWSVYRLMEAIREGRGDGNRGEDEGARPCGLAAMPYNRNVPSFPSAKWSDPAT